MNKMNYQKQLDKIIGKLQQNTKSGQEFPESGQPLDVSTKTAVKPHLFLHACCAPCSSYVLEYLTQYFRITLFYYNPNITPEAEYQKRIAELKRFIREAGYEKEVAFMEGAYDPTLFFEMARGMEDLPERGERCYRCYRMRMEEAARQAAKIQADYFTTTLSISPHKNADWINEIGQELAVCYGVSHLPSDFKKKSGYLRSIALSEQYRLYRQNYCGCVFSKKAAEKNMSCKSFS